MEPVVFSQERDILLELIEHRPDCMWNSCSLFSFDSKPQIYGSPMFDSVLHGDLKIGQTKLKEIVDELRASSLRKTSCKRYSSAKKR